VIGYRLYFLDPLGHIRAAKDFECPSDNEAVATAEQYRDKCDLELWHMDRVVAALPKLEPRD
jgi:hypothetical protein